MSPFITDSQFNSLALIVIAMITIIPATLAAYWARSAQSNSKEANANANEAKENSAGALHEVKANGGMDDPDPTLKDYIKWVGENSASNSRRLEKLEDIFDAHLKHSRLMDSALAEVFFAVKPDLKREELDEILKN